MESPPSRTGLLVSALGGLALAIGVFLPWYGVSITQAAIDAANQQLAHLPAQYSGLGAQVSSIFSQNSGALIGHEVFSVSGHQAFSHMSIVLLVIGVIATLIALFALAQPSPALPQNASGLLVAGGAIAALLVGYRVLSPPPVGALTLATKPAAWACLLGSAAIVAGALWPRAAPSGAADASVFSELSGWTPGT
jgi:hypothetical protein